MNTKKKQIHLKLSKWLKDNAVKIFVISIPLMTAIIMVGVFVSMLKIRLRLQNLEKKHSLSLYQVYSEIVTGYIKNIKNNDDQHTFLILGIDELDNRGHDSILTDTMMLANFNKKNLHLNLLSLPRDLWYEADQLKINQIYDKALEKDNHQPQIVVEEKIAKMTNIDIDTTVVVSIKELAELIDLLGGITVTVDRGFVDELYPRKNVDISVVTNPDLLYKTIKFEAGQQHMNGDRALMFARSRHALGPEGNDLARTKRQQKIVKAIISKLQKMDFRGNPGQLARLYLFYKENYQQYLAINDLLDLGFQTSPYLIQGQKLTLTTHSYELDLDYTYKREGNLYHPDLSQTYGQWAYKVYDQKEFQKDTAKKLGLSE